MAEQGKKPGKASGAEVLTGTVPEWATTTVIAQLLGKTVRRVQQLTQEGILETQVPPQGGTRKYRTCETVQRYLSRVAQKAQEAGDRGRAAQLALKKLEAEVELKESQGQLHRLKTAIAEGKYLPARQATEDLAEFLARFRVFALQIPPRIAGTLAGYTDALTVRTMEQSMRNEVEGMLAAFVDAAQPEEAQAP